MEKQNILKDFDIFSFGDQGIGSLLTQQTNENVFNRLGKINKHPLTQSEFNQFLILANEKPVSEDFFKYYWLSASQTHPYNVMKVPGFSRRWINSKAILSLQHLKWGLFRIYFDGLLWFGNIGMAFKRLASFNMNQLNTFYNERRFDVRALKRRGVALPLQTISKDDRYLISEMACKSYGENPKSPGELKSILIDAYRKYIDLGGTTPKVKELLNDKYIKPKNIPRQGEFNFSLSDVLEETIKSEKDIDTKYNRIAHKFFKARDLAITNTELYLSMVTELDVYVATSMRNRDDFRNMARICENIFRDKHLNDLKLRYFDPTLSAARGHEDKGLIECLMVKCSRVLIYCAEEEETYGKVAEAVMALSLGKPVIFFCKKGPKLRFFKEVHPLSRIVDFNTGVANGAIITDELEKVIEILCRIFENKMEYYLEQYRRGYFRLKEKLTDSVYRLQTNDKLLTDTFWHNYQPSK